MNMILFLFIVLATMFVASGINNVVTVMNGTKYFMDKAGVGDVVSLAHRHRMPTLGNCDIHTIVLEGLSPFSFPQRVFRLHSSKDSLLLLNNQYHGAGTERNYRMEFSHLALQASGKKIHSVCL